MDLLYNTQNSLYYLMQFYLLLFLHLILYDLRAYKYHQSSTYGDYYLQEVNNISYCYFEEEGKMYYMTEEDDDYNYIAEYLFTLDLSSIDTSIFKNKGEYYTVDENYLDEVGLLFTGYEEEVLDFRMYIVDNKLSNITLETIYEDDDFRVILDIEPASKGHALILPKEHYANFYELPDELAAKILLVAKKVITKMTDIVKCDGYNVLQNNGEAAGQTVFHYHMHLIPRYQEDEVTIAWNHGELSATVKEEILTQMNK